MSMENLKTNEDIDVVVAALQVSPSFFTKEILGTEFWSKQEEIAISVRDNRYTTVRACHDVGKTYTLYF